MDVSTEIYAANVAELEQEVLYHTAYREVTEERRKKTDSFRFPRDRQLSLGAELLLMQGLKRWGINRKEMKYAYGTNGKPYLPDRPDIHFNLSHSGEMVLCAISLWEVGCDIEKISDINLELTKKYFCESEYERIVSQKTKESKQEMFFRLWTLKESFIKWTGMGMHMSMSSFHMQFDTDGIRVKQKLGYENCYFQEINLSKDYRCSICGLDKKIGTKEGVPLEILRFCDILCLEEGPSEAGRSPEGKSCLCLHKSNFDLIDLHTLGTSLKKRGCSSL